MKEGQQQNDRINEVGQNDKINMKIKGQIIKTLVDTGSEISVISDLVLNRVQENTGLIFLTLPVVGVTIVSVTGVRSERIITQVVLQFELGKQIFEHIFLVIKGLNLEAIFGNNLLINH